MQQLWQLKLCRQRWLARLKCLLMKRSQFLDELAHRINEVATTHPLRVAIDGADAAGKPNLPEELITPLEALGRPVIRASIDGFHNPAHIRRRRGSLSPQGYYLDSFDHKQLTDALLAPLGPGGSREYCQAVFDYPSDREVRSPVRVSEENAVLLFDGVFLLRPELSVQWDFSIFVSARFETTLARAQKRDAVLFGGIDEVRERYARRYIPGQQIYLNECRPAERATVVVDNNDPDSPQIQD